MRIGIPKEVKIEEYRVGMAPAGARDLVRAGHEVIVESGAGDGSGYADDSYCRAGARIVQSATEAWDVDLVMKVKEPLVEEFDYFRPGLVLFTFLHLAAAPSLTERLLRERVRGIAYETIRDGSGRLPLLRPMSEIAGRMAIQAGAHSLQRKNGGKGVLLGGVPGTSRGRVMILGGGVVGTAAAEVALGMGAQVTVLDTNLDRLTDLEERFGVAIETLYSNSHHRDELIPQTDLIIGSVLIPGGKAPRLIQRSDLKRMEAGTVLVDVAVDQGGCIETCRPTFHDQPTFMIDGVVHYCVANMPGAVPKTSTSALTNATLPYVQELAKDGIVAALGRNQYLAEGVNTWDGYCTNRLVAKASQHEFRPLPSLLETLPSSGYEAETD
ncbi:MAG: alanine dehydrogenase [Polyangiaceae bacterium]|nr:alanine dehydrogenase [Polyangiaceae bacterium]